MSTNKYKPHVLVLPEDDANRQIANGFELFESINRRSLQVLPPAGGWAKVVGKFGKELASTLRKFPKRHVVMVIDFDKDPERFQEVRNGIPADLLDRVFIIGSWDEPEDLRSDLGDFESIGGRVAEECYDTASDGDSIWNHELLRHNADELARMKQQLAPFLFEQER
ncbi:MAG: hypothetical protein ACPGU7_09570 [Gammaproteobacteria bacterium]